MNKGWLYDRLFLSCWFLLAVSRNSFNTRCWKMPFNSRKNDVISTALIVFLVSCSVDKILATGLFSRISRYSDNGIDFGLPRNTCRAGKVECWRHQYKLPHPLSYRIRIIRTKVDDDENGKHRHIITMIKVLCRCLFDLYWMRLNEYLLYLLYINLIIFNDELIHI